MTSEPDAPLFADRPEWEDVVPLPQYENVDPLAPIFYTDEYKDATNYFRGIVKTGEMSPRVLELTENIIRQNPAHYSAWQYRYKTLMALKAPLDVELRLMDELAVRYLKTYQVWHHRRLLVTETREPGPELEFITKSLQEDMKNYHTWSYRQWLLAYFNDDALWSDELNFADQMLESDIRNNSAWHHRFFVVFQSGVRTGDENREEVVRRELAFVKNYISLAPNNASAWNYLRGILDHSATPYSQLLLFVTPYSVPRSPDADLVDVIDLENPPPSMGAQLPCVAAIEFLADIHENEGGDDIMKATELWRSLADEHDTIRKKYWEYRIRDALQKVQV
ncbi:hypothetical protein SERLADRAFT_433805 [Serpula lacrymans var. lacrymans S7.9]|uniref:Protein farnesyltransferase/geranylgeranyltransferase type-1 subunit alpha n=1 Tax=Serpula lacrymans var. lacrymans (strain S7.9) TaxID=578457 RepID=F8NJF4_SERL9|nr:uncharacterized protein SERLADRAFT_433805 [Serpula lacrymans var. lacrymans S7.9]EGO29852.1 hypothetical protein SERLADRAFT_433805 [Serpula lacrymans var. lacrymans S7.9]